MSPFRLAILIAFITSSACTSAPQPTPSSAESTEETVKEGSSTSSDGLGETPAEEVVRVETSQTETVEAPDGCTFESGTDNLWGLACDPEDVRVSKNQFRAPNKVAAEASIDSLAEDMRGVGVELVSPQNVELSEKIVGRTYEASQNGKKATIFIGVRYGEGSFYRAATCGLPRGTSVSDSNCRERIEFLAKYAEANRSLGISIYGKKLTFSDSCKIADRSVFCAANEVSWIVLENTEPDAAVELIVERYQKVTTDRGGEATRLESNCSFDGESIPCAEVSFKLPDYGAQSMLVGVLPAQGGSVALVCNFIPEGKGEFPTPCSNVFTAERTQNAAE